MKVCVFGAGAVGGHIAARLSRAGADVSMIARPPIVEAVRKSGGLTVRLPGGEFMAPLKTVAHARELGPQDYVVVTVKAPSLTTVAADIGPLLKSDTAVVFGMNGIPWWFFHGAPGPMRERHLPLIDPGDAAWNNVGPERAIGAVVNTACTVVAPGVIQVASQMNRLILGEPSHTPSERVTKLAEVLRQGGLTIETSNRIRDDVWEKLIANLGGMPLAVLTLSRAMDVYNDPICVDAIRRIIGEVTAIGQALGCDIRFDIERQIAVSRTLNHKPSMVQDLEAGRTMEIDSMLTVPLQLAKEIGVAAPTLELMAALVTLRAQSAGLYRTASAGD